MNLVSGEYFIKTHLVSLGITTILRPPLLVEVVDTLRVFSYDYPARI